MLTVRESNAVSEMRHIARSLLTASEEWNKLTAWQAESLREMAINLSKVAFRVMELVDK